MNNIEDEKAFSRRCSKKAFELIQRERPLWLPGEFYNIEDFEVSRIFDLKSCIDWIYVPSNVEATCGIASRVQRVKKGDTRWDSFTTRWEKISGKTTEYEKLLRAINSEERLFLSPGYFSQTYVDSETEEILSTGLCKTIHLVRTIRAIQSKEKDWEKRRLREVYNAKFFFVYWWEMKDFVKVWVKPDIQIDTFGIDKVLSTLVV